MKRILSSEFNRHVEPLENRIAPAGFIFAAGGGIVQVFADPDFDNIYDTRSDSFTPFTGYTGPIFVATGDFDGDGNAELVTAKGSSANAEVRVWDVSSGGRVRTLLDAFTPFNNATKGVSVAAGDINNDGLDELIVGAGPGRDATVKIYRDSDSDGAVSDNKVDTFVALGAGFTGGVRVAAGNIDNVAGAELIAASWKRGGTVRTFTDIDQDAMISDDLPDGRLEEFQPFGPAYTGGINVASGPIENAGGGGDELLVANITGAPTIDIYSDSNSNGRVADDPIFDTLSPQGSGFKRGASVAVGDTDDTGFLFEVITAPTAGAGSKIKLFDDTNDVGSLLSDNATIFEIDAFPAGYQDGVNLAFGKVVRDNFIYIGGPRPISDAAVVTTSLFVPARAGVIRDLDIDLELVHAFSADLDVTLTHVPSGTSIVLFTDVGGTSDGFSVRLSDEAGIDLADAPATDGSPVSGTFRPESPALLSIFDGLDASGEWRLTIVDDFAGDNGTLLNWQLFMRV